jgi:transcriptional regulator with XRE-family HTH domain
MSKPVKFPEIRKEAFTKAREALGLTVKDVSGMSCFSVRQIEQIENGEITSFYGEQNKVTAAKKVAGLLNLKEEDAFDFSGPTPPSKSALDKENKADAQEITAESSPEKNAKAAKAQEIKSNEPIGSSGASKVSKQSDPKKRLFILVGIAAALLFSVVNLRPLFFPEPPKEELVIVQEVVQAPEPELKPEAVAPVAEATAAPECPAADSVVINYKSDAPKKPGDMVYAQSKTAQTICVVDATGKTQMKTLEPGVGVSIYGKPPFKVLTGSLNQVDLFYQGSKVRLGNTSGKTIVLEPVEISQSTAPAVSTDSQLR